MKYSAYFVTSYFLLVWQVPGSITSGFNVLIILLARLKMIF